MEEKNQWELVSKFWKTATTKKGGRLDRAQGLKAYIKLQELVLAKEELDRTFIHPINIYWQSNWKDQIPQTDPGLYKHVIYNNRDIIKQ